MALPLMGAFGQTSDSTRVLNELEVHSSRLNVHSIGYRLERIDTFSLQASFAGNLAEILTRNTNIHMRSYGVNGISSPNLRGGGNNHTTIFWNGINLQSPTLGEIDLGLVPSPFVENVTVQFGGTSSLFGAGALGGSIHLNNKVAFNKGFLAALSQNYGSFGRHQQFFSLGWSTKTFSSAVKFFNYKATNDFQFLNTNKPDNPKERREHNAFEQSGLLIENSLKWNPKNIISSKVWLQANQLEVPNSITLNAPGNLVQDDDFIRALVEWEHAGAVQYNLKSALIAHSMEFGNEPPTTFYSLINDFTFDKKLKDGLILNAGLNSTSDWAHSDNYGSNNPGRNRLSLGLSIRHNLSQRTILNYRFKEELVDNELTPFAPSLGLEHFITPEVTIKASVSRNYFIPTFNQLYWSGAGARGNSSVQSETSWSQEVGLAFSKNYDKQWFINSEITTYSNVVDNWIIWLPQSSQEWSPGNIKEVWSRGVESSLKIDRQLQKLRIGFVANYSYTRATNQEISDDGNSSELGKQLIYTPRHSGKINLNLNYRKLTLGWWHHITGSQFTDGSNNQIQALNAFGVSSIVLQQRFKISHIESSLQFEINNLFNENYYVRTGYPMPLRNIRFGLTIKL